MAYRIEEMISEEEVNNRIRELGEQITKDYAGRSIRLVCILRGAVFFMCELAKRIELPVSFDFMSVSSYGSRTTSSGIVRIIKDLEDPVDGEDVIIVEDIIDTGRTLALLKQQLLSRNPRSLKICTAFDKPSRRVIDLVPDYNGITVPDEFIVGYGLDLDGRYRDFDDIRIVRKE